MKVHPQQQQQEEQQRQERERQEQQRQEQEKFVQTGSLSEEAARESLLQLADAKCCWGTAAARELNFEKLTPSLSLHYGAESFMEARSVRNVVEPFTGGVVDGPENGTVGVWDVNVQPTLMFRDERKYVRMPHTTEVYACTTCQQMGRVTCPKCRGRRVLRCKACGGKGYLGSYSDGHRCYSCSGEGLRRCSKCHGVGSVVCGTCDGAGKLQRYKQIIVDFSNHVHNFVLKSVPLDSELVTQAAGKTLFSDTKPKVEPVSQFQEDVNAHSHDFLQQHERLAQSTNRRIRMQQHYVRCVPVLQCDCTWKEKPLLYFVYGTDRQVQAPDYPQTCCWLCRCQLL